MISEDIIKSGIFKSKLGFEPLVYSVDGYYEFVESGYQPLIDWRFYIDFPIRLELQHILFGSPDVTHDHRFFMWIWDNSGHYCREFMTPLYEYRAEFMSHIIAKGARQDMRYDTRNICILSRKAHDIWDKDVDAIKKTMNIWPENQRMIELLKKDYQL